MNKLSKQERWILEHSPSGMWDIMALRDLLPVSDQRSRRVQLSSLSRSVSRLVERGLVDLVQTTYRGRDSRGYRYETVIHSPR